jgi:hypothetical protein
MAGRGIQWSKLKKRVEAHVARSIVGRILSGRVE